jgi:anti-anti-sigma factor
MAHHPFDAASIALVGELDMTARDDILAAGTREFDAGALSLAVDMREATFMDSTALGALVTLRNIALERGGTVTVCNLAPHIRRVFEITGLLDAFGIDRD